MQDHQRVVCAECTGFGDNRQTIQGPTDKLALYYAGNDFSEYSYAIGSGGKITLKTRLYPEPRRMAPDTEPVNAVEISVIDTGCGIPRSDLPKIFDPFFTTKAVGKGTGLGLSVSHGAVQAHGGDIQVQSKVGGGTVFRIYLPVGKQEPVSRSLT